MAHLCPNPGPDGPDNEPLSRTDLNLLRPTMERPINPTTRRERKRADASYMKSRSAEPIDDWPRLTRLEILFVILFYANPHKGRLPFAHRVTGDGHPYLVPTERSGLGPT